MRMRIIQLANIQWHSKGHKLEQRAVFSQEFPFGERSVFLSDRNYVSAFLAFKGGSVSNGRGTARPVSADL